MKDYIDRKEIHIVYCPTEVVLPDYFTKLLQGSQFIKFRNLVMGIECPYMLSKEHIGETYKNHRRD